VPDFSPGEIETTGAIDGLESTMGSSNFLTLLFLVISAFLFLRLMHSLLLIVQKIRRSKPILQQQCRLIFDDKIAQPFSFFHWVFIPANMQNDLEMMNTVLMHEATHAHQWHSIDKLFTEILKTVLWWNPFFFYLQKQLYLCHEYEADAAAAKSTGIKNYANILLNHFFPGIPLPITHSFYHSPIKSRIMMLLTPSKQPARQWMLIPVIGLTVLIFSTSFRHSQPITKPAGIFNVVVDAGHGGLDAGAMADNIKEKDLTLLLARALQQKAEGTNINVILTRNGDELPVPGNKDESLRKRVALAQDADAMVSLHIGMALPHSKTNPEGVMAYVSGKNDDYAKLSMPLATAMLNGFTEGPLKVGPNIHQKMREMGIYVLDSNPKPAVLLEVGFISNSTDVAVLSSKDGINKLAECLLKGLQQYQAGLKNSENL
jgi:N-acetylmuramoyl-L-alanine amidase